MCFLLQEPPGLSFTPVTLNGGAPNATWTEPPIRVSIPGGEGDSQQNAAKKKKVI